MRPNQQNRRMRGRGNRKGPNPLTRSYESNGPDVKIRGSAQQIAEKYAALARDAQSSGDRVMAENYLQHAEHYNRIIAAAQAQMPVQTMRDNRDDLDEDVEEEREELETTVNEAEAPKAAQDGSGPQPVIEGTPAEVAIEEEALSGNNGGQRQRRNGAHAVNGAEGESNAPRRPRRPRRNANRGEAPEGEAAAPAEASAAQSEGTGSDANLASAAQG